MTIIVPIFNESENMDRLSSVFKDYLAQSPYKSKVLFVDDGSTDDSISKIEIICKQNRHFQFIKFEENKGLSAAIKVGIEHSDTLYTGYIDADLQTTPYDFDKLLAEAQNYDAVIGFRGKRKDTFSKKIQSKIANFIRRSLIDDGIIDTGCPLKVVRTDTMKKIPFFDGMHRFIPALVLLQKGRIKQIEVQHFERVAGKSKFNIFNRSIKPLIDTFAYLWMKKRYINYDIEKLIKSK
jgi:glycosyltransferase involved in cell wall biosynthesis